MLQSAEADNFIRRIVQCYRTLGTVYMTQSNPKLAYENFRKQIALIEENEIQDINLPRQYASSQQCALVPCPDEALKALEKGSKVPGVHIRYYVQKAVFYEHVSLCGHVQTGEQHSAVCCASFENLFD